jgi:hypothetical protein
MGIFRRLRKAVIGEPVPVPEPLLRAHPELAEMELRRGGLAVRVAGWTLLQSSAAAITLWRTVYLGATVRADAELLLHELRHVQQFQASRAFPLMYLWESLKRGYHRNRFELDAQQYAGARLAQARRTQVEEI